MHINMALLLNICKFNGCAQIFQSLIDLIQHIEETHIKASVPLPERSQPACLPLSYILPYNPPCDSVAPSVSSSGAVNGADSVHRPKSGVSTVWGSAALGATMTSSGGNSNNQPSEITASSVATTSAVNGSSHGMLSVVPNGTTEQNGAVSGTAGETSKNSTNQPTGTADLKRKIAIKHHSYSISSSNRSTTPTGSELDDDDMMVSESEDSNDSWTTEEFSSEFIMRYGSRRHSSSGTGNGSNSSNEKPFACPVPGCKKRYKNVNGIKYHSKNGHKKDGNRVRKGFKCFCGKSYKTNQRLKIHNMLSHGPGWTNVTASGSTVPAATTSSSGAQSNGSVVVGPIAPTSESDVSVAAFETIPQTLSVSMPGPAASNQSANPRSTNSSANSGSNQNSSVSLPSTWDNSFTVDFTSSETTGIGSSLTNEHDQTQDQANVTVQTEKVCSNTSNSNGSNSSVCSTNSCSGISNSSGISNCSTGCGSSTSGSSGTSTSGIGTTNRSISLASSSYNSSLGSSTYPNSTRFPHINGGSIVASSQNGISASNTTSPPPLPPPTSTLVSPTTSGQSCFTIAAQTNAKRTLSSSTTTAAATLVISPIQASHGISSGGCFATSTPISSPVSIKYDSLGILTPATSPKLLAANISPENGQQLLASAGVSTAVAVATPLPPVPSPAIPTLNANVVASVGNTTSAVGSAAPTGGETVGIALVVSPIGGCSELNNTNSTVTTATTSNNNAVVLSTSSATSQLYAEET